MNKKNIIILISVIIICVIFGLVALFIKQTSSYNVTITFDKENISAAIINSKTNETAATINGNSTIQLPSGTYSINFFSKDKSIREESVTLAVDNKDTSAEIKTVFTDTYVKQVIAREKKLIDTSLYGKYPELSTNYSKQNESIIGNKAEWYVASFEEKVEEKNNGDVYTVILKKENNSWQIKTRPQLINTIYNTSDIPEDILTQAYEITSNS